MARPLPKPQPGEAVPHLQNDRLRQRRPLFVTLPADLSDRRPFKIVHTTTGPLKIPLTEVMQQQPPDMFRYSEEQIREMLHRGKSETVERSGESDSGLPIAMEAEQTAREAGATSAFITEADETPTPFEVSDEKPNLWPLVGIGLLMYLFGG